MDSDRIREIQSTTAYPDSVSVHTALMQVWNECEQESKKRIQELGEENEKSYKAGYRSSHDHGGGGVPKDELEQWAEESYHSYLSANRIKIPS